MGPSSESSVESLLAAELNELSVAERNKLLEDIHGVDDIVAETSKFVSERLHWMQEELSKIKDKDAYHLALKMNRDYVTGEEFSLMFLRADGFDAKLAAKRLVRFLDTKREMFGDGTLGRPLYVTDLDSGTRQFMELGKHQILPQRSRSGKLVSVTCMAGTAVTPSLAESAARAVFYVVTCHIEQDEETQKRGGVHVVFFPGKKPSREMMLLHQRTGNLAEVIPIRLTSMHFCAHTGYFNALEYFVMYSLPKSTRIRLRIHHGTPMECKYSLVSFGIQVTNLVLGDGAELNNTAHMKWINKQKVKDGSLMLEGSFSGVDIPGNNDVLLGRGRNYQDCSGNIHMRRCLVAKLDDYKKANKDGKADILDAVVCHVHDSNGRFLERQNNGWFRVVPLGEVRVRIAGMFKTMSTTRTKKQPRQEIETAAFVETEDGKRVRISMGRTAKPGCFETCLREIEK